MNWSLLGWKGSNTTGITINRLLFQFTSYERSLCKLPPNEQHSLFILKKSCEALLIKWALRNFILLLFLFIFKYATPNIHSQKIRHTFHQLSAHKPNDKMCLYDVEFFTSFCDAVRVQTRCIWEEENMTEGKKKLTSFFAILFLTLLGTSSTAGNLGLEGKTCFSSCESPTVVFTGRVSWKQQLRACAKSR